MPPGGRRPGAGHPSDKDVLYLEKQRHTVRRLADPHWESIVSQQVSKALTGDLDALNWLTPWILGAKPKEPEHLTDNSTTINQSLLLGDLLPWWNASHQQAKLQRQRAVGMLIDGSSSPSVSAPFPPENGSLPPSRPDEPTE